MPRRWIQVCRVVGVAAAVAVALSSITPAAAQYLDPGRAWIDRDAQGRRLGTQEPRSGGGSVLRDPQGRRIGGRQPR